MGKHYKAFGITLLIAALLLGGLWYIRSLFSPTVELDYKDSIYYYSWKYDLDPTLVLAVIKTESNFDPEAVSHAGAYGLMQITEDTLKWAIYREGEGAEYTVKDLTDPKTNIRYGCLILSLLMEDFQDTDTALAAYNAGRGNVLKWLKDSRYAKNGVIINTPFEETNQYIEKINKYKLEFQEQLGESK